MAKEWDVVSEEPMPEDAPMAPSAVDFSNIIRRAEASPADSVSPKGARSEMQVMPDTARKPGFGVRPAENDSPEELDRVGVDYAAAMLERYGTPALAGAAYNAGPGALEGWLNRIGDPRKGEISEADFIAQIPFKETNNYVERVVAMTQGAQNDPFAIVGEEPIDPTAVSAPAPGGDDPFAIVSEEPITGAPQPIAQPEVEGEGASAARAFIAGVGKKAAPDDTPSFGSLTMTAAERVPLHLKAQIGGALLSLEQAPVPFADEAGNVLPEREYDLRVKAQKKAVEDAKNTMGGKIAFAALKDLEESAPQVDPLSVKGVYFNAIESGVPMLATVAASMLTKSPSVGLALMGSQVGLEQYAESAKAGRTPGQSTLDGTFMAFAETAGEKIPLGIIMKEGGKFLPRTLKAAGAESIQEMFTQVLQTGYDVGILNEKMTLGEATRAVIAAGLTGGVMGGTIAAATYPLTRGAGEPEAPRVEPTMDQQPAAPGGPPAGAPVQAPETPPTEPTEAPAAPPTPELPPKPRGKEWQPLFDEDDNQIGWHNTKTGAIKQADLTAPPEQVALKEPWVEDPTAPKDTTPPTRETYTKTPGAIAAEEEADIARLVREAADIAKDKGKKSTGKRLPFDFKDTFPEPADEALREEGRPGFWDENPAKTPQERTEALRAFHEESIPHFTGPIEAMIAARNFIESGLDPETGKPPKTPKIKASLEKESKETLEDAPEEFENWWGSYADTFGVEAANAFQEHILRNYDTKTGLMRAALDTRKADQAARMAEREGPGVVEPPAAFETPPSRDLAPGEKSGEEVMDADREEEADERGAVELDDDVGALQEAGRHESAATWNLEEAQKRLEGAKSPNAIKKANADIQRYQGELGQAAKQRGELTKKWADQGVDLNKEIETADAVDEYRKADRDVAAVERNIERAKTRLEQHKAAGRKLDVKETEARIEELGGYLAEYQAARDKVITGSKRKGLEFNKFVTDVRARAAKLDQAEWDEYEASIKAAGPRGLGAADEGTLKHYAKGLGIQTDGLSRQQIVAELDAKGAQAVQSSGIINIPAKVEEVGDRFDPPRDGGLTPLFEKLRSLLRQKPNIIEDTGSEDERGWRFQVRGTGKVKLSLTGYGDKILFSGGTLDGTQSHGMDMGASQQKKLLAAIFAEHGEPAPEAVTGFVPEPGWDKSIFKARDAAKGFGIDWKGKKLTDLKAEINAILTKQRPPEGTRDAPIKQPETADDIQPARDNVETMPTAAQKEAGNYAKGHVKLHGLDVTIETPRGAERQGPIGKNGKPAWTNTNALADYGYIKRTDSADGEQLDVYIGPNPLSEKAFVIDQYDPKTGAFDEHKAVLGVDTVEQAMAVYDAAFSDDSGPARRKNGGLEMAVDNFKKWVSEGDTKQAIVPQAVSPDVSRGTKVPSAEEAAEIEKFRSGLTRLYTARHAGVDYGIERADIGKASQFNVYTEGEKGEDVAIAPTEYDAVQKAVQHAFPNAPKDTVEQLNDELSANAERRADLLARDLKKRPDDKEALAEIEGLRKRDDEISKALHHGDLLTSADQQKPKIEAEPQQPEPKAPKKNVERTAFENMLRTIHRVKRGDTVYTIRPQTDDKAGRWTLKVVKGGKALMDYTFDGTIDDTIDAAANMAFDKAPVDLAPEKRPEKKLPTDRRALVPKMTDVGEAMAGKRAQAKNKIEKIETLDKLLEQALDARNFRSRLAPDATTGANVFAENIARSFESFTEKEGKNQGGGRGKWRTPFRKQLEKHWEDTREGVIARAAEYIAVMDMLGDALAGAKNVGEIHAALKGLIVQEVEERAGWSNKIIARDWAQNQMRPYLHHYSWPNVWGLEEDKPHISDAATMPTRATPLVRPSIRIEDITRPGLPERRKKGQNVKAEDFRKTFGFRGVEFGNWVTGREGQAHVNAAYDALLDFAEILGAPPKAISIGGKLGLAFGSRGKGFGSAHYEPSTNVINLTKTKGDGSLSHEWGHALDFNLRSIGSGTPSVVAHPDIAGQWALKFPHGSYVRNAMEARVPGAISNWEKKADAERYGVQAHTSSAADRIAKIDDEIRKAAQALRDGTIDRPTLNKLLEPLNEEKAALRQAKQSTEAMLKSINGTLSHTWDVDSAIKMVDNLLTGRSHIRGRQNLGPVKTAQQYVDHLWQNEGWSAKLTTKYKREAQQLGKYWVRPEELWARSFESFIYDELAAKGQTSPYLVNDWVAEGQVTKAAGYRGTPYPAEEERANFALVWRGLLDQLEWTEDGSIKDKELTPLPDSKQAVADALAKIDIEKRWAELEREKRAKGQPGKLPEHGGRAPAGPPTEGIQRPEGGGEAATEGPGSIGVDSELGQQPTTASEPGRAPGEAAEAGTERPPDGGERRPEGVPPDEREGSGADRAKRGIRGLNFRIAEDADYASGSPTQRILKNIEAIRVVLDLEKGGQLASREDQEQLAHYVGWGASGLAKVFDEGRGVDYGLIPYRDQLKAMLTPEQFESARATTINAHYTSQDVVRGIWDGVYEVGFTGSGNVLEPGMGIGNFIGMRPKGSDPKFIGVELDDITGKIARGLYPEARIFVQGFEDTALPEDSVDLVIGNVPFGDIRPSDKQYNKGRPLSLHNYFIFKSLKLTKPGGVLALVTSRYTMDSQDKTARTMIRDAGGDLIGAIRLPNTTFKENAGTQVVTDILFIRKRKEGEPLGNPSWLEAKEFLIGTSKATVNQYFKDNPDMVLGTNAVTRGMYRDEEYTVTGTATGLREKIANAVTAMMEKSALRYDPEAGEVDTYDDLAPPPETVKDNAFFERDGKLFQRVLQSSVPVEISDGQAGRVRLLIKLRDLARAVLTEQRGEWNGKGEAPWIDAQKELGKAYDRFVKAFGYINQVQITRRTMPDGEVREYRRYPNMLAFRDDPDAALVSALERFDEEANKGVKGPIFTARVVEPTREITRVNTPDEALIASMNMKGTVDVPYMAKILGRRPDTFMGELKGRIFRNPATGNYEPSEVYLSGNVRGKLAFAKEAAKGEPEWVDNVKALEAVQPVDLRPSQIAVRMGTPWIPNSDVEGFISELLETEAIVEYVPKEATWHVRIGSEGTSPNNQTWAVNWTSSRAEGKMVARRGIDLIRDALNQKSTVISWQDAEGKTHTDMNATIVAQEKQNDIKERFAKWVWKDPERGERLARFYNENFNNLRVATFNGDHLSLPGSSTTIELRSTQKKAVWRYLVSGNTLLDHLIGAGKTFTAIASAMEAKRIGLLSKPLFSVPNHMLEQFSREFMQLYPNANILVADERAFAGENRRRFVARAAAGNWDSIIMTHSSFERVSMSNKFQADYIRDEIAEYADLIRAASAASGGRSPTVKQLEASKKRREEKLRELMQAKDKDRGLSFEEMGVDGVFVDEAHLFKNLEFATKITNMNPPSSQRSFDLYMKTKHIDKMTPGRGIMFMTGTPISNSMAEMYTMQRYLQPRGLAERGLTHFDAWASTFGDTVTQAEITPEGGKAMLKTRFARFRNIPELISMYRQFSDLVSKDDLIATGQVKLPKISGGGPKTIIVPASDALKVFIANLGERAEAVRKREVPPDEDNMLLISTDGRKASLDLRVVDPTAQKEKVRKASEVAANVARVYKAGTKAKHTQIVFCDMSVPSNERYSIYRDIKEELIKKGVNANEIAFVQDANTDQKKANLFADVRAGRKRILMGSTEKMGIGTNVQDRLKALHHVDPSWRPSDIEQRDGRIERQGNTNEEIDIFRYVTEGSFDAYMWQTVERKARFINQIKRGDPSVREAEDIDEQVLSFAEAKALAAGNPLILDKAKADSDVDRLSRLRGAHYDNIHEMEWQLHRLPGEIAGLEEARGRVKEDNAAYLKRKDNPQYTILGTVYEKRPEASKALADIIEKAWNLQKSKITIDRGRPVGPFPVEDIPIGTMYGFKISVEVDGQYQPQAVIHGKMPDKVELDLHALKLGAIIRIENFLKSRPSEVDHRQSRIDTAKKKLADFKDLVKVPFEREEQYQAALKRQRKIDQALGLVEADPQPVAGAPEPDLPPRRSAGFITGEAPGEGLGVSRPGRAPKAEDGMLARRIAEGTEAPRDPAFKRWFGKSKVVNPDGTPKVVYHGTDGAFDTFERTDDVGFHFGPLKTANKRVLHIAGIGAPAYQGWRGAFNAAKAAGLDLAEGSNLIPAYLKIEKPLRLPDLFTWDPDDVLLQLAERGIISDGEANTNPIVDREYVRDALAKKGYDGIVYKNVSEGGGDSYIVFDPSKIKSVFNEDFEGDRFSLRRAPREGAASTGTETRGGVNFQFKPEFEGKRAGLARELRAYLINRNLPLAVRVADSISLADSADVEADGHFDIAKNLITIALDSKDPFGTISHEAIHALRTVGFFTDAEWATLMHAAQTKWKSTFDIVGKYYKPEVQAEETVAFAAQNYENEFTKAGKASWLLQRVRRFFEGLRSFLRGHGFETPEDIFDRIRSGEIGKRGKVGKTRAEAAGMLAMRPEPQAPFYSALLRGLEGVSTKSASSEQWTSTISNLKGVKKDEIDWSGIREWLATQKGPVPKAAIYDYLKANEVQIREVMKGGKKSPTPSVGDTPGNWRYLELDNLRQAGTATAAELAEMIWLDAHPDASQLEVLTRQYDAWLQDRPHLPGQMSADDLEIELRSGRQGGRRTGPEIDAEIIWLHRFSDRWDTAESEEHRAMDQSDELGAGSTRFGSYTLPGGENYRELLLTLPEKPSPDKGPKGWGDTAGGTQDDMNFRSGHFEEPNIIAHIRFKDRVDADGKKVLAVEEFQSDWHQQGRKKGYRTKDAAAKYEQGKAQRKQLLPALDAMLNREGLLGFDTLQEARAAIVREWETWDLNEEDRTLARQFSEAVRSLRAPDLLVVDAPFKATWHELALKRMLRYAAEHGYDKIAWTTGEQQAERYGLVKHVSRLVVEALPDGRYKIEMYEFRGGAVGFPTAVEAKDLSDHVGQELATKIVNDLKGRDGKPTGGKTYSGLDLKVGGEGMKGFYDRIVPQFLNRYAKKWDAKVGQTQITTGEPRLTGGHLQYTIEEVQPGRWRIIDMDANQGNGTFMGGVYDDWAEVKREVAKMNGTDPATLHSLDVTPAMRESVMQGQGMFARRMPPGTNPFTMFTDQPQPSVVDYLRNSNLSLMQRLKGAASLSAINATIDNNRVRLQDRYLKVARMQVTIEQMLGRPLTEEENAYLAEELSSGRKGAKIEDLFERMVRPLVLAMHERGISRQELETFLYARHAPERNARINEINPKFRDEGIAGSGMTDEDARDIMNEVDSSGRRADFDALAAIVDNVLKFAVDERLEAGLLSQEQADAWRATYQHYVPLRGVAELDPEVEADRPRPGKGFDVKGKESHRAFGRQSPARDILSYAFMQAEEAIIRGENNRIGNAVHALAKAAPNENFWKVDKVAMRPVWIKARQEVQYWPVRRILAEDAPFTLSTKIDGKEHRITFNRNNPVARELAQGMKGLGQDQIHAMIRYFGTVNRILSHVNTTLNPEFVITNAFRDMQTALSNIQQYGDVAGITKGTVKDYRKALVASTRSAFKTESGRSLTPWMARDQAEWDRWAQEFRDNGGRVYFNRLEDVLELRKRLDRQMREIGTTKLNPLVAMKTLGRFIENTNIGVENAIRLSAYKNARERGFTPAKAASLAKNLTVNFNRRGSWGPAMNALYLFYNASVQGTFTMLTAWKSPRVRKVAAFAVMTGFLLDFLNSMISDEDDDGQLLYDKVTPFDKSRNLIVMTPSEGGVAVKLPLPYGYNIFYGVGRSISEAMRGKDVLETVGNLAVTIMDSFNPVGGAQNILNMVMPTAGDPVVDLFLNKDYAGRPIAPEQSQYGPQVPNSQRYWNSVSPAYKAVTDFLSTATGGTGVEPGLIEISPEWLDYGFGVAWGAAGTFYERNFLDLPMKLADPTSKVTFNDIPFVRRVITSKAPWIDKATFYERIDKVEQARAYARDYQREGRRPEARGFVGENRALMSLYNDATNARTELSEIRAARAKALMAKQQGRLPNDRYNEQVRILNEAEDRIIRLFNTEYLERTRRRP